MRKLSLENLKKHKILICLFLILLSAVILRFYNITDIGLRETDEGTYLYESSWLSGDNYGDIYLPLSSLKPLYDIFVSISLAIFGYHDYSGHIVSALFGILTIIPIFFIGRELFNNKVGLTAALFFAFLKMNVIYSRSVLPETTMVFFMSLGMMAYVFANKYGKFYWYLLAGVFIGLSFEAKYFGFLIIFLLIVLELSMIKFGSDWKRFLKNSSIMLSGFAIIFFAFWLFYASLGLDYLSYFLGRVVFVDMFFTLFEKIPWLANIEIIKYDFVIGNKDIIMNNLMYAYYLFSTISLPILLLSLYGMFSYSKKWKKQYWFLFIWIIFDVLVLIKLAWGSPKMLVFLQPVIVLIAAFGIFQLSLIFSKKNRNNLIIIMLIISVIWSLVGMINVLTYHNDAFKNAGKYVLNNGGGHTLSDEPSIMSFYTHYNSKYLDMDNLNMLIGGEDPSYRHIVLTTHLASTSKASQLLINTSGCVPVAVFDYELEEWKIPVTWKNRLIALKSKIKIRFIERFLSRVVNNIKTNDINQKVLVYNASDIQSCLKDFKPLG